MSIKQKKTPLQRIKWWWNTRIVGFWRIKFSGNLKRRISEKNDSIVFKQDAKQLTAPTMGDITVILTAYRRAEYLAEQIQALRAQTVPPKEIWVWSNRSEEALLDVSKLADRVVVSNTNWLFWGRFSLANLVRTEYVAFFDDDILPQPKWFENCLDTIKNGVDGILGGSGVLLPKNGGYSSKTKAGWNGNHLNTPVQVDLVGHAWFMRKAYVSYMWREEPSSWDNGEDIHLSYMALKHGGIKTYVPPHPEDDQSLWSCRPDFGKIVGRLKVATYKTKDHKQTRTNIVNEYREDGWKIVSMLEQSAQISQKKNFSDELDKFNQKLINGQNFSLVRFGDGEMIVINGESIDLSEKCNGEHKYTPGDQQDEKYRKLLEESLLYKNDNYYVGLPCRCCVGDEHCENLRQQSQQHDSNLSWANIFVNANYSRFMTETVDILSHKNINMICHSKAKVDNLPFQVKATFRVGANAWVNDYQKLLPELTEYINQKEITDEVFIFCAGVLSNMLIYQLTKACPQNTYIDSGSVFDDVMKLGKTRKYLKGRKKTLNKVCIW